MLRSTSLVALALLTVGTHAFVPAVSSTTRHSTALGPKFLKDLGFEKPSWLPDFGGGKKDEEEASAAPAEQEGGETSAEGEEVAQED